MRATFPGTSAPRITGSPFPRLWAMCEREKANARDIVRAKSYRTRSGLDYIVPGSYPNTTLADSQT